MTRIVPGDYFAPGAHGACHLDPIPPAMHRRPPHLHLLLVLLLVPLAAPADVLEDLVAASALRCEFQSGRATRWEQGQPVNEADRFRDSIVIHAIDHDQGMARMRGAAGGSEVVIVASVLGVTFLEGTEAGNLNVVTVYPYLPQADGTDDGDGPRFAAVMSRHVMIEGHPLPSQHTGTCRPEQ